MSESPEIDRGLQSWLDDVATYDRAFKSWESRVEKILKRYRDEGRRSSKSTSRFNILWSNVQTLVAATFSRLPKPDVSRRFRDQDPVGRVASLILERGLDYHVQHYPEYRMSLKAGVADRFLGGRGTAWVRYEPHFRATGGSVDGDQVTEDQDTPDEELDYECVAVDYVHWRDFGHTVARTWEEVPRVWRKVYMNREALIERFGDLGKKIPMDVDPGQPNRERAAMSERSAATIYEGWDKPTRKAVWFSKSMSEFLDQKDDPLGLEDVFPCPRPLYATLVNDSLEPTPDFSLYQDQAAALDLLSERIEWLSRALRIAGGYDSSIPELQRIFDEGSTRELVPVKNWQAFAEKNGLVGSLSLVDLTPIAAALQSAYEAFEQIKRQIHEITGISDIVRGQTQASETATAQQIKGQYASLRLRTYQDEVARYASDLLGIMAQVMCRKFAPQTLAVIGGVEQLTPQDQQLVGQALALLVGEDRMRDPDAEQGPNSIRQFRIEVAADSLVHLDEQAEQESRIGFLTATSGYLKSVAEAMQSIGPQPASVLVPLLMDMLKFGVTGFKVGKQIEGAFDEAAEKLKQIAMQPPPQPGPPPEVQLEQIRQSEETKRHAEKMGLEREKMNAEIALKRDQLDAEQNNEMERRMHESNMDEVKHQREREMNDDAVNKQTVDIRSDISSEFQKITEVIGQIAEQFNEVNANAQATLAQSLAQMSAAAQAMSKAATAPRKVMQRDQSGRISVVAPILGD